MRAVEEEKGIAFLLVMFAVIMFAVTSIVVMTGLRTQGNVTSMLEGSKVALARAEDGLTIALTKLKQKQTFGNGFEYRTADNWTIQIVQTTNPNGSYLLKSTASKDRFSRSVAVDYTSGGGPQPALEHAVFAQGNIDLINGWVNLNKNSIFTNSDMKIANNFGGDGGGGGEILAHGTIDNKGNINNTPIKGGQDEIPFPELDFEKLTAGQTTVNQNQLLSKLQSMENTGGTLVVQVNSSEVALDGNINIKNATTVIFVKAPGFTGDYVVHFKKEGWNVNGGELNLIADGGTYHFNNFSLSTTGIIYSNYAPTDSFNEGYSVHVNNSKKEFSPGGLVVKGKIKLNNMNMNVKPGSMEDKWGFLNQYWKSGYIVTHWREL